MCDIAILKEGNRRWTMKEISKIEKRVDRLEYYSSLNLIEQDVNNLKIFDNLKESLLLLLNDYEVEVLMEILSDCSENFYLLLSESEEYEN